MSPSSSHDRFRHGLTEYVLEALPSGERAGFDAHLGDCAECRSHLRFVKMLRDRLAEEGEELLGAHPRAEELVAYATEPDTLERSTLQEIGLHLQSCVACAEASESTRRVEGSLVGRWRRKRLRPWIWSGVGAAAAAVVLVALLPLSTGPDMSQPSLVVLPVATRGEAAARSAVPEDTPLLLRVPVDPWNTRSEPGDFTLTAVLLDEKGDELWRAELSAERAYDLGTNAVHVLVPAWASATGPLRFVLRGGETVLYENVLASANP